MSSIWAWSSRSPVLTVPSKNWDFFFGPGRQPSERRVPGSGPGCHHHAPPVTNRLHFPARCPACEKEGFGWTLSWAHTCLFEIKICVITSSHCRFILLKSHMGKKKTKKSISHLSEMHLRTCKQARQAAQMFDSEPQTMSPSRNTWRATAVFNMKNNHHIFRKTNRLVPLIHIFHSSCPVLLQCYPD